MGQKLPHCFNHFRGFKFSNYFLLVCIFHNCLLMKNTTHSKYVFFEYISYLRFAGSRLTKIWIRVHQENSCWQKFLNAVSRISSKMCPVVRYTCALAVHRNVFWWDLVLWPFLFVCLTWGDSRAIRAGHHAYPKESFWSGPRKVII